LIGPNDAELEYRILDAVSVSTKEVGSGTLHLKLRDSGVQVSQATIGRVLYALDHRGMTTRVSNQGRVLTSAGKRHLADLRRWQDMRFWLEKILAETRPGTQSDYTEALDAICHLEGHLAGLAAIRATDAEVRTMRKVLELHEKNLNTMSLGRHQGLDFHGLVAKAARNQFLDTALNMIWSWNTDLREIWAHAYPVTGRFSFPDHMQIFHAIERHDSNRAERAMRAHYEIFIDSVRKHFGPHAASRPSRKEEVEDRGGFPARGATGPRLRGASKEGRGLARGLDPASLPEKTLAEIRRRGPSAPGRPRAIGRR